MTALAIERLTPEMDKDPIPHQLSVGVKAAAKIYGGSIVVVEQSTGYAKPGVTGTGLICLGRAELTADNTSGASGAIAVLVRQGAFKWANGAGVDAIAATDVGKVCYVTDDQTVALTSAAGTKSIAGRILQVDTDGVWVLMGLGTADPIDVPAPSLQTGSLTLVTGTKVINTVITITAASKIFLQMVTPGGAGNGVQYKLTSVTVGAPSTGAFTVTAVDAASGATVASDVSVLNYLIVG